MNAYETQILSTFNKRKAEATTYIDAHLDAANAYVSKEQQALERDNDLVLNRALEVGNEFGRLNTERSEFERLKEVFTAETNAVAEQLAKEKQNLATQITNFESAKVMANALAPNILGYQAGVLATEAASVSPAAPAKKIDKMVLIIPALAFAAWFFMIRKKGRT